MSHNLCSLPNSNQVGGQWEWIHAIDNKGCSVYITCSDLAGCFPPVTVWDGESPDGSISVYNDGAGSPEEGHLPYIVVNVAGAPSCIDNALTNINGEGLCVPRGANIATGPGFTGTGTTADPVELDFCGFGAIPNGVSVTHVGFDAAGCLVRDTIPVFAETPLTVTSTDGSVMFSQSGPTGHNLNLTVNHPANVAWTGAAQDGSVSVIPGGVDGHAPVIGVNVASALNCPNNLIVKTPSGLCAQETPVTITSTDGTVGFTQSGTADHTIDLSVPIPANVPWTGTAGSNSVSVTSGGTDGHAPIIDVNVASVADCANNLVTKTPSGLCVQETPVTITSTDGTVSFTQSGTANHTVDLSVPIPANVPWTGTAANQGIAIAAGGTDGHAPMIGLAIATSADCPDNIASIAASGLCVQDTPLVVTSTDGSVGFSQSGVGNHNLNLTVAHPANPPLVVSSPDGTIEFSTGGTDGHTLELDVDLCGLDVPAGTAVSFVGVDAAGCLVTDAVPLPAETPLTVTSTDGSVTFSQSGTSNHTVDLSVAAPVETALVVTSPNSTIEFSQSGTADHAVQLDIDWCGAGADIPNGTIDNAVVLGVDSNDCVVKQAAGFFAQSGGANDFIPLGSNYDVSIDYGGANGTAINGQPVFDAGSNTLWLPLISDDDYRRIGDVGPTYKLFTEADQAWRTGDVVWGDSAIQADTKGDFRGNLNVGPLTNVPTAGQFVTTQGDANIASGLYAHASGVGAVASGAMAPFARGVVETAGGWAGPTQATGTGGFSNGRGAQANNEWATAMGRAVQANGEITMGFGSFIRLDGHFSGAVGRALTSTGNGVAGFLGGGFDNTVDTLGSAIVGAANNLITGNANFSLSHGNTNTINSGGSSMASGDGITIDCFGTSFAQGRAVSIVNPNGNTEASGTFGRDNTLSGEQCYSFGRDLITDGFMCFNQGQNNTVLGNRGTAFGQDNFVNNVDVGAVIGSNNTLNANAVDGYLIGVGNVGDAQDVTGLGKDTNIIHAGTAMISATTNVYPVFTSAASEEFAVRAPGGVRIATNGGATSGAFLNAGGSFWGAISARSSKTDIEDVGERFGALDRIARLPLYMFRYHEEERNIRNLGPMAEEWVDVMGDTGLINKKAETSVLVRGTHRDTEKRSYKASNHGTTRATAEHDKRASTGGTYQVSEDEKSNARYETQSITTISPNDLAGLALAGMQELINKCETLTARVEELEQEANDSKKKLKR